MFGRIYVIGQIQKFSISDYHLEDNCILQSDPYKKNIFDNAHPKGRHHLFLNSFVKVSRTSQNLIQKGRFFDRPVHVFLRIAQVQ